MSNKFDHLSNDQLLQLWQQTQDQMKSLKAHETEQREAVINRMFKANIGSEGTVNIELGNGYKLKGTFKKNINFTNTEELGEILDKMEADSPEGKLLADRIVKWKPSLVLSEYRQLPDNFANLLNKVLIVTDASPSVEIVPPKAK